MRFVSALAFVGTMICSSFALAQTPVTFLTPTPVQHFVDLNGKALVGGKVFTYAAGSETKVATYTDSTGTTPNTNPIILNARGEAQIWLLPNQLYKIVLAPANDTDPPTNPIWTVDNIEVASSGSGGGPACSASAAGLVPATGGGTTTFLRADCTFASPFPPPSGTLPSDLAMFWPGTPPNSQIVRIAVTRNTMCPINFSNSVAYARDSSSANAVVSINQVSGATDTNVGSVTFSTSNTGVFSLPTALVLTAGQMVEFAFPASADATLGDIAITLQCSLQ